jgi:mannose-6-phosphate isomerase-like protein (cupin superfamily)
MPSLPYHAVLEDLPRSEGFEGKASRTCIVADGAIMQAIWVEPGLPPFPVDQHDCDQTVFVFQGELEITLNDDDVYRLKPGHVLYIPSGVPHMAQSVGEETLFGLDVFAPVRPEYLALAEHQLGRKHDSA